MNRRNLLSRGLLAALAFAAPITPLMAQQPDLSRKMSAVKVPDELAGKSVGCAECHTLNASDHRDTFEHGGR